MSVEVPAIYCVGYRSYVQPGVGGYPGRRLRYIKLGHTDVETPHPNWLLRLSNWLLIGYWLTLALVTHLPRVPSVQLPEEGDKGIHFAAYGLLALLWAWHSSLRVAPSLGRYARMLALLAAYAALDEILQIPCGRDCEAADWLADVVGGLAGLTLFAILAAQLGRRPAPRPEPPG